MIQEGATAYVGDGSEMKDKEAFPNETRSDCNFGFRQYQ